MAFISTEGGGVLNNASKAHLFGATFLVYNFGLLEECREKKETGIRRKGKDSNERCCIYTQQCHKIASLNILL